MIKEEDYEEENKGRKRKPEVRKVLGSKRRRKSGASVRGRKRKGRGETGDEWVQKEEGGRQGEGMDRTVDVYVVEKRGKHEVEISGCLLALTRPSAFL